MYMTTLVSSSSSKGSSLTSSPMVQKFEDVFPSEVTGCPKTTARYDANIKNTL